MLRTLTLLCFIAAAFVIGAFAQSPPVSCYRCPADDQLGFPVGEKDENSDPIFCSYPAVEGEDPLDFFCTYSFTTGALVQDNDADLCQPNAVNVCNIKRKRDVLPRSPRYGQQARSPKPANMQTRSKLKRNRLDDQA